MTYRFIIRADQPYDGTTISVLLSDETIAYTKGQTLDEYRAERDFPIRVIDEDELVRLETELEHSLATDPEPETVEQFESALNVLPPARWHRCRGVQLFHVAEPLRGRLVEWHGEVNGQFFRFVDTSFAGSDRLADKVSAAFAMATA